MTDCYVTPHDSAEVTEEISVSNTTGMRFLKFEYISYNKV